MQIYTYAKKKEYRIHRFFVLFIDMIITYADVILQRGNLSVTLCTVQYIYCCLHTHSVLYVYTNACTLCGVWW